MLFQASPPRTNLPLDHNPALASGMFHPTAGFANFPAPAHTKTLAPVGGFHAPGFPWPPTSFVPVQGATLVHARGITGERNPQERSGFVHKHHQPALG